MLEGFDDTMIHNLKKRIMADIKLRGCAIIAAFDVGNESERWGAGVETQKYVRGDIGGWGRVPFNETYAPSLSTIYDGA